MTPNVRGAALLKITQLSGKPFKFANPEQILKSIQVHCFDMYGSMLWDIFGQQAAQYYRCWGTCVKLCWDLPRSTHTYFVEHLLARTFSPSASKFLPDILVSTNHW